MTSRSGVGREYVGGDHLTRIEDDDAGREGADQVEIVTEQQDAEAGGGELSEFVDELQPGDRVEAGARLVEHEYLRAAGERLRERYSLPLTTGELMRKTFEGCAISGQLGRADGLARVAVMQLRELLQRRADASGWVQRTAGMLRHVGDDAAAYRRRCGGHSVAVDNQLPGDLDPSGQSYAVTVFA